MTGRQSCDRCGEVVRAVTLVRLPECEELPVGGVLTLCGHHTNKHRDALVEVGADLEELEPVAS